MHSVMTKTPQLGFCVQSAPASPPSLKAGYFEEELQMGQT